MVMDCLFEKECPINLLNRKEHWLEWGFIAVDLKLQSGVLREKKKLDLARIFERAHFPGFAMLPF